MSDFKLQRLKYQYSGTRANSDVKIRIDSGDRWKEIFCPELVNQQSIPITENEGFWFTGAVQEDGFEFQGFAKIKLYEGDQYIGEFQVSSSDVTTTDNNPYQSIRTQDGAYYTLSYRVLGTARNIGIDIDGSRIEISPREVGLVFVPKYNRRWLINVASKKRVKETNLRAKYIQKVNANQGARVPWLGPYTIEDGQQQLKLKVKDPADTTGAFQIGAKDFITYWNAKGGILKYCEIDNGLDENLALGRGHNGLTIQKEAKS